MIKKISIVLLILLTSCNVYRVDESWVKDDPFFTKELHLKEVLWVGIEKRSYFMNNNLNYNYLLFDKDIDGFYDYKCDCTQLDMNLDSLWNERLKYKAAKANVFIINNRCVSFKVIFLNWKSN